MINYTVDEYIMKNRNNEDDEDIQEVPELDPEHPKKFQDACEECKEPIKWGQMLVWQFSKTFHAKCWSAK